MKYKTIEKNPAIRYVMVNDSPSLSDGLTVSSCESSDAASGVRGEGSVRGRWE